MDAYEALDNYNLLKERLEKSNQALAAKLEEVYFEAGREMAEAGTPVFDMPVLDAESPSYDVLPGWYDLPQEDRLAQMFSRGLERIGISDSHYAGGVRCYDVEIVAFNGFEHCAFLAFLSIIENYSGRDGGSPFEGMKFTYNFLIKKNVFSKIDVKFSTLLPMIYPWISTHVKLEHWQPSDSNSAITDNETQKANTPAPQPNPPAIIPNSTPVKRKINGKKLVFLILTYVFGALVLVSFASMFSDHTGGMVRLLFYSPLFALFLWLYLRKGKGKDVS